MCICHGTAEDGAVPYALATYLHAAAAADRQRKNMCRSGGRLPEASYHYKQVDLSHVPATYMVRGKWSLVPTAGFRGLSKPSSGCLLAWQSTASAGECPSMVWSNKVGMQVEGGHVLRLGGCLVSGSYNGGTEGRRVVVGQSLVRPGTLPTYPR